MLCLDAFSIKTYAFLTITFSSVVTLVVEYFYSLNINPCNAWWIYKFQCQLAYIY